MCPVCITTAVLIAGGVTSTGGLAAIAIRKFGGKMPQTIAPLNSIRAVSTKERSSRNRPQLTSKEKSRCQPA
jgi:hypothetical protein